MDEFRIDTDTLSTCNEEIKNTGKLFKSEFTNFSYSKISKHSLLSGILSTIKQRANQIEKDFNSVTTKCTNFIDNIIKVENKMANDEIEHPKIYVNNSSSWRKTSPTTPSVNSTIDGAISGYTYYKTNPDAYKKQVSQAVKQVSASKMQESVKKVTASKTINVATPKQETNSQFNGFESFVNNLGNTFNMYADKWQSGAKVVEDSVVSGVSTLVDKWQSGAKIAKDTAISNVSTLVGGFSSGQQQLNDWWESGANAINNFFDEKWNSGYIAMKQSGGFASATADVFKKINDVAIGVRDTTKDAILEINNELNDATKKDLDLLTKLKNNEISLGQAFLKKLEETGATITQVGLSLLGGLSKGAEALMDTAVTSITGWLSLRSFVIDFFSNNVGTNSSITSHLYDTKDKFVEKDYVGDAQKLLYNDSDFGKWVSDNSAISTDGAVSSVVSGIGQMVTVLSTASALGALAEGTNGTMLATSMSGLKGFGMAEETALKDGASTLEASLYGLASGSWDALQMYAGMKINSWTSSNLTTAAAMENAVKASNAAFSTFATSVALDGVDSALEGYVQPALQMIYKERQDGESFGDFYNRLFEEMGGAKNVGTQFLIGSLMSAGSTGLDMVKGKYAKELQTMTDRYQELENIRNTDEYKTYMDDVKNGKEVDLNSNFKNIEQEYASIANELKKIKEAAFKADNGYNDIGYKIKKGLKVVGGATVAVAGVLSLATNPLLGGPAGLLAFYRGIGMAENGIYGNYAKDTNFAVQRRAKTAKIESVDIDGKTELGLSNQKIVTDRIFQKASDLSVLLPGLLEEDHTRLFGLELVNLMQQLKATDTGGNKITYSCHSHAQTYAFLRKLSKEGYIDASSLKRVETGKKSLGLERFLMGIKSKKPVSMYEIQFQLTDKVFDQNAAATFAKTLGFDPRSNLYSTEISVSNGKAVTIYKPDVIEMMKVKTQSTVVPKIKSVLDKIVDNMDNHLIKQGGLKEETRFINAEIDANTKAKYGPIEILASTPYKYLEKSIMSDTGINDIEMYNKIMNDGLIHFTSLDSANKIMESGEVRPSKTVLGAYDNNRAFFFAGDPTFGQLSVNLFDDFKCPTILTGVRIKPTEAQLDGLKFRYLDDMAVSKKGKFTFDSGQAEIVYYGITKNAEGKFAYQQITEEMAANYDEYLKGQGFEIKHIKNHGSESSVLAGVNTAKYLFTAQTEYTRAAMKTKTAADKAIDSFISKTKDFLETTKNKIKEKFESTNINKSIDKVISDDNARLDAQKEAFKTNNDYNSNVEYAKKIMAANINEKIVSFYENARKTGKKFGTFSGYEEHNYVHVTRVADASTKLTKVLNEMIENGILGKEYAKISENTIYIAGLAHDLGMTEGGYVTFKDGTMMLIKDAVESTKDPNFKYTGEVKKMMKTSKDFNTLSLAEIEAQLIRGQHPLNSAITVLKNKDIFGEDSELIACLTLIHSKSTSGVKHIVDIKELSKMVETLYEHQEAGAYKFNVSKLVKCDANGIPLTEDGHYIFNDGVAEQFRTGAVALRVGDAHALKTGYNHGGGKIVITSRGELKSDDYLTSKLLTELAEEEAINSQIQIEYDNQNIIVFDNNDSDQLFSKRIILGESNVRNFDSYCDDKVLIHPYEVLSTDNPANTWLHGIQEKFGEYKTFGEIGQKVIVELPSDLTDDLFNVYKRFANDYAIDNEWLEIELRFGDNVYNTKSQITITS